MVKVKPENSALNRLWVHIGDIVKILNFIKILYSVPGLKPDKLNYT